MCQYTLQRNLDLSIGSKAEAEEKGNLFITWRGFWNQVHGQQITISSFHIHLKDHKHLNHFVENDENIIFK